MIRRVLITVPLEANPSVLVTVEFNRLHDSDQWVASIGLTSMGTYHEGFIGLHLADELVNR
jgi:hypothetical protein